MNFLRSQSVTTRTWQFAVTVISTFIIFQFVSLYLSWPKQLALGGVSIAIALITNRSSKSHVVTLALMLLSLAATLRYGWWRVHTILLFFKDESNTRVSIDSILMLILLSAEVYTTLIMILGFMQTSSPLRRKPLPLPSNEVLWPHVDVLIPTYNEPLSLVRYTALAAMNMDYPPEKLHVYILDDGTRSSFRDFAEEAGVGYIVRKEHNHAKAGNINHALTHMSSPLVTIFDCDHVPTRSFLQLTVGWFLAEEKLAMLQTPHHFYSPDPFERNLLQFKTIPNEGGLFYGIIQDGSDLWNATFFCGSCAVIRRSALDQVGGIATETVTEDAHTSLRMQKKGWDTAYINLPQAAGLATETLAAHVGQRVRWARGMIQILRTENPLLASGMKFTQRLCYFNAMLHFMYAVPRLIFLCAPLFYMLFGRTIIPGYWLAILAYSLPHLFISSLTNSRVQGKHRHSFWNEIYETVLAPYILMPTLLALLNPKLGKFNVTDKGSTLMETSFDRHIAAPTSWLLFFNLLGVCVAPYRFLVSDSTHPGTVISNLVWICFNMVILGVAAAVANEQQQRRKAVRIPAQLPVKLHLADGRVLEGTTKDMSIGGAWLRCPDGGDLGTRDVLRVSFPKQTGGDQIGATVIAIRGDSLRLRFTNLSIPEEETLTCALYSRADSWIGSREKTEEDRPLISLIRVTRLSVTGFHQVARGLIPRRRASMATSKNAVASAAALLLLLALTSPFAMAQIPGSEGSPVKRAAGTATAPEVSPTAMAQGTARAPQTVTLYAPATPGVGEDAADAKITLKDMGVHDAIDMHGPHNYYSVGVVLGHSRMPRLATLEISYWFSSALLPRTGSIKFAVNKTPIAQIDAPDQQQQPAGWRSIALPIPADILVRNNELTFEFTGGALPKVDNKTRAIVLARVGSSSRLLISGDPVPLNKNLALLPLPFFDADLQTKTTIPFVFLTAPSLPTLKSAAILASWLGSLTRARPVQFSVSIGQIPRGNVIILANGSTSLPAALARQAGGASLSLRTNPSDPEGTALILAGDDDEQLLRVARSVSLMTQASSQTGTPVEMLGDTIQIGEFPLPSPRQPDDAPRWLTTDHISSLWSLSSREALQSDGSRSTPVYFRVPPDLYYGENQNLSLKLAYRYNALPLATGSALRVLTNASLVSEIPLPSGVDFADRQRSVLVPVANMRPFSNTLLFNFDFVPTDPNDNGQNPAEVLAGSILESSYLDIRGLAHWAALPNLELFANAGFPFTRRADLADTVVVIPAGASAKEITLLLYLMSHCGAQTGYPALRVEIAGPDTAMRGDRDYLVLGGSSDQPAFRSLDTALPVTLDAHGIHVKQLTTLFSGLIADWRGLLGTSARSLQPSNKGGVPDALVEAIESPQFPGRSIVLVSIGNEEALDAFAETFLDRAQSSDISQTVSLFRHGKFSSYKLDTPTYHVGNISAYPLMRIWLAEHSWLLLAAVTGLSLALATYLRDYLAHLAKERLSIGEQWSQVHSVSAGMAPSPERLLDSPH